MKKYFFTIACIFVSSLFALHASALTTITTCQGLQDMNLDLAGDYELGSDIDCSATSGWNSGAGFEPIGGPGSTFTGTFNGNSFTILDLVINRPAGTTDVGLFGATNGATISNVGLEGTGSIIGSDYVGALIADSNDTTITNVHSTLDVAGLSAGGVGGLIGLMNGTSVLENCYATGDVDGQNSATILYGGLVGYLQSGSITECYATGDLTDETALFAGGLVGGADGTITRSYATGNVSGTQFVGGFAGAIGVNSPGTISNSYSRGAVTGAASSSETGGFTGYSNVGSTVTNVYATGNVSVGVGSIGYGGFVGTDDGATITSSYWDTQTSGQVTSDGGTSKTTTEMKQEATFSGWNFASIWNIDEGISYPYFSFSPGFTLSGTTQSVTEAGGTDTFTVVLNAAMSNDVVIAVTSGDTGEATVSPSTLTFTSSNWDTPQTVTVTGVDDADDDGDQSTTVTLSVTDGSSDDTYDALPDQTVTVTTTDDDSPAPAPSGGGSSSGTVYGCKDATATNYNPYARHDPTLCTYTTTPAPTPKDTKTTLEQTVTGAQCPFFSTYQKRGDRGPQVKLIQTFLQAQNINPGPIDGIYGAKTREAIKIFQSYYSDDILKPWGLTKPTGRWYQSTRAKANQLAGCSEGGVELDNGVVIE